MSRRSGARGCVRRLPDIPIGPHLSMRPPTFIFLCSSFALCSAVAFAQTEPPRPRVVSPEITADRHVTFRLGAPAAHEVELSGEFTAGKLAMHRDATGVWSVTVGPLAPEMYCYNFTIDGVRTIDPGNPQLKTGSTASTLQSVLDVRGPEPAFYDVRPVPHGDVRTLWYESRSLGMERRVTIYLPPDYDAATSHSRRYPVLYLFHGANADESTWIRLGRANLIMDNLLADQKTVPCIVVMPFGYGVDPNGPGPHDQNTAQFSRDLLEDVIPLVDARYRTQADRGHRAIIGLSMGGGEALNIGLNHLDRFSYVGGFSAGIGKPSGYPTTYATLVANPDAANRSLKLLWIGCGREDPSHLREAKAMSDFLEAHHITHTYRETAGAHTWTIWRQYLHEVAPLLFR